MDAIDSADLTTLTRQQVVDELPLGWALLIDSVQTRISTGDLAVGATLVDGIAAAAQTLGHDPASLTLRPDAVDVRLSTEAVRGLTAQDLRLAADITTLVEQAGLAVSIDGVSRLEMGLDSPDRLGISSFWAAVLDAPFVSSEESGDEVRDPAGGITTVWFQPSGSEEPRQHWHPDVWIDPSAAEGRIRAAIEVGGTLVSDAEAPAFWVLADPEGNKVCLCTWQSRDEETSA